jgi:diguanylate cyclase (GGDEF)-like protein
MTVPLSFEDQVTAIVILEARHSGAYTNEDAQIAAAFAGQAGIAVTNARLFEQVQRMARTDDLTSTLNRRHFFVLAQREFARARRYERPLSAVMLDIDHFKQVNDTYGHATGDEVLRQVAQRCRSSIRDVDILGRYGGEEFALLLPDTTLASAKAGLAERLRRTVADEPVITAHGPITVTVSLGVAELQSDTADVDSLLDSADSALYQAKAAGRNRVEALH